MKRLCFLLLITLPLGCQEKTYTSIEINPLLGNNNVKDNIRVFDLIEDLQIIGLPQDNNFLLDISQLKVSDNYIFFVEKYARKIYRLELQNNNITPLFNYGKGPGEIQEPSKILIENNKILVLSKPQSKLFFSELNGIISRESKLDFFPSDISIHENSLYFTNGFFEKSGNYIKKSDLDLNKIELFGSYPVKPDQMDFAFSGTLQDNLFAFPFGSNIYEIKNKEELVIQFNLENGIKDDELFDHKLIQSYLNDFNSPKNFLQKFYLKDNQGIFQFSINNRIEYSILLSSGQFFGTEDFELKYNPFLLFGQPKDFRNGYFYTVLGEKFKEWFLLSKEKNKIIEYYTKEIKPLGDYLAELNEDTPPAIIKFRLKESY